MNAQVVSGDWVRRGAVLVWDGSEPDPNHRAVLMLNDFQRRVAHARFNAGDRDPATCEGEREYQCYRKRVQRGAA